MEEASSVPSTSGFTEARHAAARLFASVRNWLPADDWAVIGLWLATTVLIFSFATVSYQVLDNQRPRDVHHWFKLWDRWDAIHYHTLARYGYKPPGALKQFSTNFYPFYPWAVRAAHKVIRDYIGAAFAVSGCACAAAAVLLRRLVAIDFSAAIARRAVWFFLIFPTAYFLRIGYAESLFLALSFGSLLAARKERWWLAGLLGACACMTRPTGIALIPALGIEIIHQWWIGRRWRWEWLWVALVPCGFGVFLLLNYATFGDALAFMRIRKQFFYNSIDWPWNGIAGAWGNRHRPPRDGQIIGIQETFFLLLGLVCCLWGWWKMRPSYAAWASGNWLLFSSVAFVGSVPRYTLPLIPVFVLFAVLGERRIWERVITTWSLLFLALFSSLYVRGWWAF